MSRPELGRLDRVVAWATSRRVPWWALAVALWATLIIIVNGVKWLDGSLDPWHFHHRLTADTFYGVLGLVAYGSISRAARRALDVFSPYLDPDEQDLGAHRRQISSMSDRVVIALFALGASLGVVAILSDPVMRDVVTTSVPSTIAAGLISYVGGVGMTLVAFGQVVRVLRLVSVFHREARGIDVFRPDPAHAFSRVTALAGALVVVNVSYSFATDPSTSTNPIWIVGSIVSIVLAVMAFVLPLRGMHVRLRSEKHRLLDESAQRFEAVRLRLHLAIDAGDLRGIGDTNTALAALEAERQRVEKVSTWPWRAETLRGFASTLLLPVLVWFLTSYFGRILDL